MNKLNIGISAGHSNNPKRDRGAAGNGQIEGVIAARFRNKILNNINKKGYSVMADPDDTTLSDSIKYFTGKTNEKTILLDIHLNAATPKAKGTETLIPGTYTKEELRIAAGLSEIVSNVMGIPLRGVTDGKKGVKTELDSHHGKLGWMRIAGINILMELFFISNADEVKKFLEVEDILAEQIADYLVEQSCVVLNTTPINSNTIYHIVTSGDSLSKIAQKYGTTVNKIQELNNISNPNSIKIGQKLIIK